MPVPFRLIDCLRYEVQRRRVFESTIFFSMNQISFHSKFVSSIEFDLLRGGTPMLIAAERGN